MLPNYSIGSHFRLIEETISYDFSYTFTPMLVGRPGQSLPVIISHEDQRIEQAVWGMPSGGSVPAVYPWVRSEGIIRNLHTRILVRQNRCLVPANGFFTRTKSDTCFIYFPKDRIVTFGGLWKWQNEAGKEHPVLTFSIITVPASGKTEKISRRIPLVVYPKDRRRFLNKEKPLMDITGILKKELKLEVNGFKVNPEILSKDHVSKKDFRSGSGKLFREPVFPEKAISGNYYYDQF